MGSWPEETHMAWVQNKRIARMSKIDELPQGVRALVHEYGYNVVNAFLNIGVTKPNHIKHLVETVLDEFSPTRGSFSNQGCSTTLNRVETPPPPPISKLQQP
mgnify:CR=1 FL=1